jgi:U3 small nucleolar RNA-associated protein 12
VKCKKAGSLPRVGYGRLQALVADKSSKVLSCFGTDNRLEFFWFCSDEEIESKLKKKRKKELKRIK